MNTFLKCMRQHFWQNEIGLRKDVTALALRFGSAWARAMEARWRGADYDGALAQAIPEGVDLNEYDCATLAALLAGYYDYYGPIEDMGRLHPEEKFEYELGLGFTVAGVLDGIGSMTDGLSAIVEGKTTSDSLDPDSDYWLRLTFNIQVYQYILAARQAGWDIAKLFYDVTRKPSIRPRTVDDLDKAGKKIVINIQGQRVYNTRKVLKNPKRKKGEKAEYDIVEDREDPRQSGNKEQGLIVKCHVETPDEYCDRLWRDTLARPSFYFARREVPIIDQQLETFERQRLAIARLIISLRESEIPDGQLSDEDFPRDPEAWPRNVSENTCNFCSYKEFCLQNISVDLNRPPNGFSIQPFNPELERIHDDTSTESSAE